jgi:hypothetical protein
MAPRDYSKKGRLIEKLSAENARLKRELAEALMVAAHEKSVAQAQLERVMNTVLRVGKKVAEREHHLRTHLEDGFAAGEVSKRIWEAAIQTKEPEHVDNQGTTESVA